MSDIVYMGRNIVDLANLALTRPDDFMWFGKDEMFKTWGWAGIDKNNSSDVLEECNFDIISKELIENHPDDFEIIGLKHWAVGHVDRLTVRILNEPGEVTEDNITEAFKSAMRWLIQLSDYPIADETKFDEVCYEYVLDYLTQDFGDEIYIKDSREETGKLLMGEIISSHDDYSDYVGMALSNTSFPDNVIRYAAYDLGLCSVLYRDLWDEWVEEEGLPPIKWGDDWGMNPNIVHKLNGQLEIDFDI